MEQTEKIEMAEQPQVGTVVETVEPEVETEAIQVEKKEAPKKASKTPKKRRRRRF